MHIINLADRPGPILEQAAQLLVEAFDHPFLFYRKLDYVVTDLMPDANGRGRPDIYMSKTLVDA